MNLSQILVLIAALSIVAVGSIRNFKERIAKYKSKIYYWLSCHLKGNCPTTKERRNENLKELASSLERNSYKETLSNILEWQNRNIEFWTERHPLFTIIVYILRLFSLAAGLFVLIFYTSILLFITLNIQIIWWINQIVEPFIVTSLVMLVTSIITIISAMAVIIHFNRKISVLEGLKNVFLPSISMKFLLENKLGVCRDYAKLTACLLSNIYPNDKIFFVSAPEHVATGISLNNRLYMLDQRLPISTIERWVVYRKHRKKDKIEKFDHINNNLEEIDKRTFLKAKNKRIVLDTKKLAVKIGKILNLSRGQLGSKSIKIPLRKGAIIYEDDDIVNYSLARYIKVKASNELVDMSQVTKIDVKIDKEDLVFLLHFN